MTQCHATILCCVHGLRLRGMCLYSIYKHRRNFHPKSGGTNFFLPSLFPFPLSCPPFPFSSLSLLPFHPLFPPSIFFPSFPSLPSPPSNLSKAYRSWATSPGGQSKCSASGRTLVNSLIYKIYPWWQTVIEWRYFMKMSRQPSWYRLPSRCGLWGQKWHWVTMLLRITCCILLD